MRRIRLTAVITREDDGCVAICPELDIASQGETRRPDPRQPPGGGGGILRSRQRSEIQQRLGGERYVEELDVSLA